MSDFVRIMRGWGEICKTHCKCEDCSLRWACHESAVSERTCGMLVKMEQIIENWLKDHPLPSTPTWIKWLSEHGIVDSIEDGNVKLLPLAYYPIDEEIAAKLGELNDAG